MNRILATSALCLTIGLVAAGCGGSTQASSPTETSGQAQGQAQAAGRSPGGSGEVTDVSGSTAQVKGQDAQVAVTWTGSTTFTQQVAATAADVAVGSCVMVTSAGTGSRSTDTVAAATVRITEATDGTCATPGGGRAGGGGAPPAGAEGGQAPSGERPTDRPSGAPGGQGGGQARGGFAVGKVTAVTGAGFTVSSQQLGAGSGATATTVTVTISAGTTYTTTAVASASDVKVGVCVTSRGDADDTGAITATSIAVTQPVDGACTTGFGGGRPASAPAAAS